MRTLVTFRSSAFNTSEPQPYFINPSSFGDDLARWLIAHLRVGGVSVHDTPGQEDFGWFFEFDVPEGKHCCVLGFRPVDDPNESNWVAWIERSRGLVGSIFGLRKHGIAPSALSAVHAVLSSHSEISNVRWHDQRDFDAAREELGTATP
jgi:hypothetical protein